MRIYLARHGDSVSGPDQRRQLSEKGRADVSHIANMLAPLKIHVMDIFHSDKTRAIQTAEILSTVVHSARPMRMRAELDPEASIDRIIEELDATDEDVMLVGHMPFMGKLAGKLVAGNENTDVVNFQAGSIVCLEQYSQTRWAICWMLNPEFRVE